MIKEYRITVYYKNRKVKCQELWHIDDYRVRDKCYHFINKFGTVYMIPLNNILYITVRKEDE